MIGGVQGRRIIQASRAGTVAFAVTATLAAALLGAIRYVAVGVALALFALGCGAFLWGYWLAVQRSRSDEIGIGGLFFLAGKTTAPARPKWLLLGALAAQVGVALVTASVRPYTTLAFGLLVPVFGLGCTGLWSARYGQFGPRVAPRPTKRAQEAARQRAAPRSPAAPRQQEAARQQEAPRQKDAPRQDSSAKKVPTGDQIGQNARHG